MYILILLLPISGFLMVGFFGAFFGRYGSAFVTTFFVFLSLVLSLFILYEVGFCEHIVVVKLYRWILIEGFSIDFGLYFDPLTSIMIVVITSISTFVHLYSTGYMSHDPYLTRFMSYLSLFTFFMLFFVTADNFVQMFIGWEGVGLCSYLLINFWFTRILANKAALKAMIMNRIADVFFIIAIILILLLFRTTDYVIVFTLIPYFVNQVIYIFTWKFYVINVIAFFLFIGAIGKSAQIGFHTWLPDAMEGPTPVSSLLHAATMVTAGVFLVIRCSLFFEYSEFVLFLLILFGGVTSCFAGLAAIFQYDVKKIIAYSTCSQLGYMFFSCGLSNYYVAFFHLFNHAFFKALLFLSAGSLIHALYDEQDMRRMGGMQIMLPFTYICFLIGSLAIMGFPFLTGFYSKDILLEFAYCRFIIDGLFLYSLGLFSAICTAIYSIRLLYFVYYRPRCNTYWIIYDKASKTEKYFECPWQMFISMFCLSLASIFIGFLSSELILGEGTFFWQNSIHVLPQHISLMDNHYISPLIKNLPVMLSLLFMGITNHILYISSLLKYREYTIFGCNIYKKWLEISSFFNQAGYFNNIYNNIFIYIYKISYEDINKYLDKGLFEYFGPFGFYSLFKYLHEYFQNAWKPVIFFSMFFLSLIMIILLWFWLIIMSYLYMSIVLNIGIIPIIAILLYNNENSDI